MSVTFEISKNNRKSRSGSIVLYKQSFSLFLHSHKIKITKIQNPFDSCQTQTQFLQSSINLQTGKEINANFISTMVFCFKQSPPVILLQPPFLLLLPLIHSLDSFPFFSVISHHVSHQTEQLSPYHQAICSFCPGDQESQESRSQGFHCHHYHQW